LMRPMMRLPIGLYIVLDDTKGVRPICGPNCIGYWDGPALSLGPNDRRTLGKGYSTDHGTRIKRW
jgi:hypothetical protein